MEGAAEDVEDRRHAERGDPEERRDRQTEFRPSTIIKMIRAAPATPVRGVFAPDRSATAVRDPLAELGGEVTLLDSGVPADLLVRLRQTWRGRLPSAVHSRTTSGGGFDVLTAAVGAEPPQRDDVGRDDHQGPERIGRDEEHLGDGVEADHGHREPTGYLVT
jgi:hypothetical protein